MASKQSGFVLIEIAIVLVIVGLLLGGVLKGQELINSTRVKNLASDFKNGPVFIYGYQDKFKALPGDDLNLATHLAALPVAPVPCTMPGTAGLCNPGSGIIDGGWDSSSVAAETYVFWQHIRLAGFAPGSTTLGTINYVPINAFGGNLGITNAAQTPIQGLNGTYIICSNLIPGRYAKQLDTTMDDGETSTGSMRVVPAAASPMPQGALAPLPTTTALINDDNNYLVCMRY